MVVDRLEPDFVPAALAFGSGIHGAAASSSGAWVRGQGARLGTEEVQQQFEAVCTSISTRCFFDGVFFAEGEEGALDFRPLPPPTDEEVGVVLASDRRNWHGCYV